MISVRPDLLEKNFCEILGRLKSASVRASSPVSKVRTDPILSFNRLLRDELTIRDNIRGRMCVANATCVEVLRQLPLSEMILVTGAGLSTPGCCGADELAGAVARACHCPGPNKFRHRHEFFQAAHDADATAYYATIRDKFSGPFTAAPKIYSALIASNFRAYVNLNYDPLLVNAMIASHGAINGKFTPYPTPDLFKPWALHSQRIVAIHGFAGGGRAGWEKELVLKRQDYERAYTNYQNPDGTGGLLDWWCDLLSKYRCLFIGTTLEEPGIRSAVNWLLRETGLRPHEHVILVRLAESSPKDIGPPEMEPLLKTIQRVPYHPEDARHRGLLRIWEELTGVIEPEIPVRRESVPELRFEEREEPIP